MPSPLTVFNTLSGKKEAFKPRSSDAVRIYSCGPTVYGYTHVGNARAALTLDLISRIFEYAGYKLIVARNYTDVDDKIIDVSKKENRPVPEVALYYQTAFDEDMETLLAKRPDFTPKATETMDEMIKMIEGLIQKDMAYVGKTKFGNDVYFRVKAFKDYGKLSNRKLEDMPVSPATGEESKDDEKDFALWKASKPDEPYWESPWGHGRPGWHIECSAMIHKLFQNKLDIHMGGYDLVFPHHENEIAQSEAFTNSELAPYWFHNGMIEFGKEKMSKSLGNIVLTRNFLELYGPETLRVMVHQVHYRKPMDFSDETIIRAEALVDRLYHCKQKYLENKDVFGERKLPEEISTLEERIKAALFNDFNSSKALGHILAAARRAFKESCPECWKAFGAAMKPLNEVLGLTLKDPKLALKDHQHRKLKRMGMSDEKAQEIENRLKDRELFRAQKNFEESDRIRADLIKEGIQVMDGPDGATWTVVT